MPHEEGLDAYETRVQNEAYAAMNAKLEEPSFKALWDQVLLADHNNHVASRIYREENEKLKPLRKALYDSEVQVIETIRNLFDLSHPDTRIKLGGHQCVASPIGYCIYDARTDPACDDCLVCHEPQERK